MPNHQALMNEQPLFVLVGCFHLFVSECAWQLLATQVVAAKLKIPVSSQRLFFGDTLLQDNDGSGNTKTLSQWGISTGSIVRLDRRVD